MARVFGLIFVVLLLGLGSALFFKVKDKDVKEIFVKQDVKQDTANWKEYRSQRFGYKIKLPSDWEVLDQGAEFPLTSYKAPDGSAIEILVDENKSGLLSVYLEKRDLESKTGWEGMPSKEVLSSEEVEFLGFKAVRRKEDWLPAGFNTIVTYVPIGRRVFVFTVLPYTPMEFEKQTAAKYYDQILNTFAVFLVATPTKSLNGL